MWKCSPQLKPNRTEKLQLKLKHYNPYSAGHEII